MNTRQFALKTLGTITSVSILGFILVKPTHGEQVSFPLREFDLDFYIAQDQSPSQSEDFFIPGENLFALQCNLNTGTLDAEDGVIESNPGNALSGLRYEQHEFTASPGLIVFAELISRDFEPAIQVTSIGVGLQNTDLHQGELRASVYPIFNTTSAMSDNRMTVYAAQQITRSSADTVGILINTASLNPNQLGEYAVQVVIASVTSDVETTQIAQAISLLSAAEIKEHIYSLCSGGNTVGRYREQYQQSQ